MKSKNNIKPGDLVIDSNGDLCEHVKGAVLDPKDRKYIPAIPTKKNDNNNKKTV